MTHLEAKQLLEKLGDTNKMLRHIRNALIWIAIFVGLYFAFSKETALGQTRTLMNVKACSQNRVLTVVWERHSNAQAIYNSRFDINEIDGKIKNGDVKMLPVSDPLQSARFKFRKESQYQIVISDGVTTVKTEFLTVKKNHKEGDCPLKLKNSNLIDQVKLYK